MQQRQSSCLNCRTRKVKCDKKEPCSRCLKTNNGNCVYPRQGTLGRPPKNAVFHGKGRNHNGRKLIIREFIFENIGDSQNMISNSNYNNGNINSNDSSISNSNSSLAGTPSQSTITSGFFINQEWWILSKEAIQEHPHLNTYYQTLYSFYVLRGLSIRERFRSVTYRLPEKPRLKFNTLQLLFTWWISLSVNLLVKRASQVQLETYSVPSLTLYMFQMDDKSNTSPTATTTLDGENDQHGGQQQQQEETPYAPSTPTSTASYFSSDSSPSLSSISSLSPVPIFPRMHHHHNTTDPLQSLPSEQAINLIDDFFLVHPYSILINKAKLMKEYWADTANPLLLSVIYGTTQCFSQLLQGIPVLLWESGTENNRNPFLTHAHSLLETLPTSPSTSDYQATVILALFEVVWGYPKIGMSLCATTYLMGTQLGLWDNTFKPADPVEEELVNMTFWSVFRSTTHGCIEMGASIVDSLVYHQRPFPPANMNESKSHQHNTLHKIKTNNPQAYLIESFYSGAVVAYYSGILFACLPKPYVNAFGIKTEDTTFEGSELLTMLRTIMDVETRVHMVLDNFDQYIQQQRHNWTVIQTYTIETSYRLYRIHFRFLQPTHTCGTRKYQEDLIPAAATAEDNNNNNNNSSDGCYINFVIDPTDPATAVRLRQVLDDLFAMVNELEAILTPDTSTIFDNTTTITNDSKYMHRTTLLPQDIMVAAYESSARLLMLNYQLDPSQLVYDTMTKLLSIAKLLDEYQPPSTAMKNVRQRLKLFMKQHHDTPTTSTSKEKKHTTPSPLFSDQINNDGFYNSDGTPIDLNLDARFFLHPFLQQQQQQNHQYPPMMDPSLSISSSSLSSQSSSSSYTPYYFYQPQHHLLESNSPMVSSSSSHLVQYHDTHMVKMLPTTKQQQQQQQQQQQYLLASSPMVSSSTFIPSSSHMVHDTHVEKLTPTTEANNNNGLDTIEYHPPPMIWDDHSAFIGWDDTMPNTLHPYDTSLSFLEEDHQNLGYMPFLDM